MKRRVVITSIGVISSLGSSVEAILENLREGTVSFGRPDFDHDVAVSPVRGFALRQSIGPFKNARYLTRGAQFAVAAAVDAVQASGISPESLNDCGLFVGAGPNPDFFGDQPAEALWLLRFLPNTAASAIAQLTGIHGENGTIVTACAASLQAVGEAFRKIKDGYLELALAGGGDSRLTPGGILAYKQARALYSRDGAPDGASRPFDTGREGFVPGEGGAFFLLEDLMHAQRRKARIYGEICGFGASLDGESMTAPISGGRWAEKAIRAALNEAGIPPSGIDLVCAHGTGTRLNDEMESALIRRVFGHQPDVIALKSWIGHLATACGAVELALALICMENRYLPQIRNLRMPCAEDIRFVTEATACAPRAAVIQNFGFGGQNAALAVKPWTP